MIKLRLEDSYAIVKGYTGTPCRAFHSYILILKFSQKFKRHITFL